jgi:hypothetical protein
MALIFPKWSNQIPQTAVVGLGVTAVAVTFSAWFWMSPKHTDVGYAPKQPVPYSHQLHAGQLGMDCRYCHNNVDRSAHGSVPPTQTCMNCHKQVKPLSSQLAPVMASWADGDPEKDGGPIRWKRIHKVADYAYFNHSAHVGIKHEGVGVGCVTCHGRIDQMVVVAQRQPLSMRWCLECHNNPAPNLRPIEEITNMTWTPDAAWTAKATEIGARLNPPGNKTKAVTTLPDGQVVYRATAGCTGCHR